ncbi:PEP-utilizing enzyme [Gordonia hydrophobica]|uniref:PEP-utilizing enzyme n=1 Tax=Gordonia hydrophobica TaxID=40516 RepID=A0ABZ2U6N6_9ACTN|nr:PEP-utilizing enzyme [Gordonia hydrophobica]MBM7365398.1 phosphoenolpyruvate synthase/pyruvate phosphate dikinase [Gordonia hydrophobica]
MQVVAEGFNAFETSKTPVGEVKYLETPQDVIDIVSSGQLADHILLVRGGTTTFLTPALSMGALGIVTMSGAPESHLGILSREFQTPCVMTAYLTDSDSRYEVGGADEAHFDEMIEALVGKKVQLVCDDPETGRVVLV